MTLEENQVILVIEDSEDDYEAMQRAFKKENNIRNAIIHCTNGDQALDYLFRQGEFAAPEQAPRPGVIFLDLNLPGTDGRMILSKLKQDETLKTIPVIVLTTSSDERDIQACFQAGANTYVKKPVDLDGFIDAVKRLKDYWIEFSILPKVE